MHFFTENPHTRILFLISQGFSCNVYILRFQLIFFIGESPTVLHINTGMICI